MSIVSKVMVGSLNCEGLNDFYKRISLFQALKNSDLSIIFLQETKLKPELEFQYIREWGDSKAIFNSTIGGKSGTAILINNPNIRVFKSTKMTDVEGRVIAVDMEMYGSRIHVVNSYGPNDNNFRVPFLNRMYLFLHSNEYIIWGGDHNVTTNPRLDRYPVRFNNDHGGREFKDILNCFDMKDVCRCLYPNSSFFTFRRGVSKSRIDKICVSGNFSVRTYSQENTGFSDHELIKSCIVFSSAYERGPGVWKNNVKYYKDESFLEDFKIFWNDHIKSNLNYNRNKVNWWMDFKYKFKLFYIKYSRNKLMLSRRHDQMLESGLYNATITLNQNPNSRVLVDNYNRIKKQLVDSRIKKTKEKLFKSEAQYLMQGEKTIKSFFKSLKTKKKINQYLV